jgi:hypothetical protein
VSSARPLGKLEAFSGWNSARPWGPDGAWRVTFGNGQAVIDDLVSGFADHRQAVIARWPVKAGAYPVVLGCTPWLTSKAVADALSSMGGCCVVLDKKHASSERYSRDAVESLATAKGVWQMLLGLHDWGPADENRQGPLIEPGARLPGDRILEPIRVLGYSEPALPLLHAKVAVCCGAWEWENDGGGIDDILTAMSVWVGSANWTKLAAKHIEFGAWSTDEQLCETALGFLTAVIRASEPLDSSAFSPIPELVRGEWDDEAFAELAAEYRDYDLDEDGE